MTPNATFQPKNAVGNSAGPVSKNVACVTFDMTAKAIEPQRHLPTTALDTFPHTTEIITTHYVSRPNRRADIGYTTVDTSSPKASRTPTRTGASTETPPLCTTSPATALAQIRPAPAEMHSVGTHATAAHTTSATAPVNRPQTGRNADTPQRPCRAQLIHGESCI